MKRSAVTKPSRVFIDAPKAREGSVAAEYDSRRDATLAEAGYLTLRFWNNDVTGNLEGVPRIVCEACEARLPSPSHRFTAGPSLSVTGEG